MSPPGEAGEKGSLWSRGTGHTGHPPKATGHRPQATHRSSQQVYPPPGAFTSPPPFQRLTRYPQPRARSFPFLSLKMSKKANTVWTKTVPNHREGVDRIWGPGVKWKTLCGAFRVGQMAIHCPLGTHSNASIRKAQKAWVFLTQTRRVDETMMQSLVCFIN